MTIEEILDARNHAGLTDAAELRRVMAEAMAQIEVLLDDVCSQAGVSYRWYPAQRAVSIEVEP